MMLTVILCIDPLARLDDRFRPLLYSRRHFGVMMAFVTLTLRQLHPELVIFVFIFVKTRKPVDGQHQPAPTCRVSV